jgi:cytochrome P450
MRQLPIETNPPEHTDYRAIAEPFFQRAKEPEMMAKVEALLDGMLTQALSRESIEIVNEFALPVQSRALTHLLNTSESEADTWIGWGIHVFKVTGGEFKKGTVLEDYLHQKFDEAEANPGADFFSALVRPTIEAANSRGRNAWASPTSPSLVGEIRSSTRSPARSAISPSILRHWSFSALIPSASHSPARSFFASSCLLRTSAASVLLTQM